MSYPGSKGQAGTWQRIIGQMPPHSVYVEAFAGEAWIYFHKRPAARNVLIDVDAGVSARLDAAVRNAGIDAPGRTTVLTGNAIHWLQGAALWDYPHDALIYCDPPYVLSTRTRKRYRHELTDDDHATLLRALADLKCRVMISGYPSALYSSQLQNWRCCSYQARTRGGSKTECLWCNFPEPTELHDWRYAGRNFRQRVSFGRLAARWLARLEAMPPIKRGYLLNAISQRQDWRASTEPIVQRQNERWRPPTSELARGAVRV